MDPKSETGPNQSYEGSSACASLGKLIFHWIFNRSQSEDWEISKRMSIFVRIRWNIEIFPIKGSESKIPSQNTAQHHPKWWCHEISSENQEKSKESVVLRPFHYFARPELTKRIREIFLRLARLFFALQRHPSVRPHPHGRCVCCRGSYPNILTLTFGDREGRPRTLRQPSQKRREGSRRLTVVQRVSQMDPKSETGPNHSYEGSSACS